MADRFRAFGAVGSDSEKSFARAFPEWTGVAPSALRSSTSSADALQPSGRLVPELAQLVAWNTPLSI